ncbi:hypothetical protein SAMN05216298_0048 [Glycomyces sambucus]|uniref:ATP-binding protein n=1 Tax=Glycomyces sambucus TaxID=380244 RepID=A0A1G9MYN3_9ACTN|nr:ATP-binding protein [Glycomyces sambucus]SDL79426.1 hypothetical protein SAMN05216298_0048 [Glycomyces sambucus]
MTRGLAEVTEADVDAELGTVLHGRLATLLARRGVGHCMKVTDLHTSLAVSLCGSLRSAAPEAQIWVLGAAPEIPAEVAASSTKLVELRNPGPDGRLRPPLLAFIPPGARASAEDSFGSATFEEVSPTGAHAELAKRLRGSLPQPLREHVDELFRTLDTEAAPRELELPGELERVRYLLALKRNEFDPEAAGAAVFELGLIPDFELFAEPEHLATKAARNIQQMVQLYSGEKPPRQRVTALRLTDGAFRRRLAGFLVNHGHERPASWARRIATDQTNWDLSLHRWPLPRDGGGTTVRIDVEDPELPVAGVRGDHSRHKILGAIAGQPYLNVSAAAKLAVRFEIDPHPRDIPGLARFSVELVAEDGDGAVVRKIAKVEASRSKTRTSTFTNLKKAKLEPGWYFVRVRPLSRDGVPLPFEKPAVEGALALNESGRFYIVDDSTLDEEPERPEVRKANGVVEELTRLRFESAAEGRDWRRLSCADAHWTGAGTVEASFGPGGRARISVSPSLAQAELAATGEPGRLGQWRLFLNENAKPELREPIREVPIGSDEASLRYLEARAAVAAAIRGETGMIAAGRDIGELRDEVVEYAEAYTALLADRLRRAERSELGGPDRLALGDLLRIDTVAVVRSDGSSNESESAVEMILASPIHPLRLLWTIAWEALGRAWLEGAESAEDAESALVDFGALRALTPVGFPLAVPGPDGRLYIASGVLDSDWQAMTCSETADAGAVIDESRGLLGLSGHGNPGGGLDPRALADRFERYVRMHPYVRTLVIAAVNPGRAEALTSALVELDRRQADADLRYEVRLYTADPEEVEAGESLSNLLRGERGVAGDAETFSTPTGDGTPKLAVSIDPLEKFSAVAEHGTAHLCLLFDVFSGERFTIVPGVDPAPAPVYGLVQDMKIDFGEDRATATATWTKRPRHGQAPIVPGAPEVSDLLSNLPAMLANAASAVATGQSGLNRVPQISLTLGPADGALLHQAHRCADWVITVDRTLGAEYFDAPSGSGRTEYVIDAVEDPRGLSPRITVSSGSVDELRAMLEPTADQHGLRIDRRHAATFFDQLRLLSGRLAFKTASISAAQRTEAIGLAMARMYLEYERALRGQILVPLDAHLELFRGTGRKIDRVGESTRLHRTDLALFELNAQDRLITCRLVEVKCTGSTDRAGAAALRDEMRRQIDNSEHALTVRYDPSIPREDRAVRNAELASTLRFYLRRAHRHGSVSDEAALEAEWMLDRLDWIDFRLKFTRTGLIFDLDGTDSERVVEDGIDFHRVGRGLIDELLGALETDPRLRTGALSDSSAPSLADIESTTLPRLGEASFKSADRHHLIPELIAPTDLEEDLDYTASERTGETTTAPLDPNPQADRQPQHDVKDPLFDPKAKPDGEAYVPDIFLGSTRPSPQYGVIGEVDGRKVALDLNETHTISLFGVQGSGKSYTLGTVIEAATIPAPGVGSLPSPLATIVFHYSQTGDYAPEFTAMIEPNGDAAQIEWLRERYGAQPTSLADVVLLVPEDQLGKRSMEFSGIEVRPLKFAAGELRASHWKFLMGAVGNQSTYIREFGRILKANRRAMTLDAIRSGVDASSMRDHYKDLARQRLEMAADFIDDTTHIGDLVAPGRMIIVDLRDEMIETDDALGLFVVLMELFAETSGPDGDHFNKLVVFDEAHKYLDSPDLIQGLVGSVREMRHKGMSVLVASQDPPSVPVALIELSDHVILHRFNSPAWLKHLQKAHTSLTGLTAAELASLQSGDAYVWAGRATAPEFTKAAVRISLRPRLTRHGGTTRTALS